MKLTVVPFVIILLAACMSFINEGDGRSSLPVPQPVYKQDSIPEVSDTMGAEYPGGAVAWHRFLWKNTKCPTDTSGEAIPGKVVVEFVIDEKGNVTDVTGVGGIEILRTEAVRVIKKSSKWIPGKLQSTGCYIKSPKRQPFKFGGE